MHLDKYGLPVQAGGDANDQLQRVGMCLTACALGQPPIGFDIFLFETGLCDLLQVKKGIFRRHVAADTNNCSADQIIGALSALIMLKGFTYFTVRMLQKK